MPRRWRRISRARRDCVASISHTKPERAVTGARRGVPVKQILGGAGTHKGHTGHRDTWITRTNLTTHKQPSQRTSIPSSPTHKRTHAHKAQPCAAKEVRFPCFRPDGDGERRADHSGERDEAQVVREEGGGGRARRAVLDRAVVRSMHPSARASACHAYRIRVHSLRKANSFENLFRL